MENVKKIYVLSLFYSLIPAYVIERLFWQERGMSISMVVYCEIIYALVITICEIPSGILVDKCGRKRLLVIDCIFSVLELVILLFAHNFWMFALAVILAGLGKSLVSGSRNALLYDSLVLEHKEEDFEKILGRITAIEFSGFLIAALSGSVLASAFGFSFNYMISTISMLLACLITCSLKEPLIKNEMEENIKMLEYTKQAIAFFKSHGAVLLYCLSGAVLGATMIYLDEFWQILMGDIGVAIAFFGMISAMQMIARIPGNMLAYKLKERYQYKDIMQWMIVLNGVCYICIFFSQNVYCIIPIVLLCIVSGIMDPIVFGYLHHHAKSTIRATVESFYSLGLRMLSMAVGIIFSYVSDVYTIFNGFLFLGIVCLVTLIVFYTLKNNMYNNVN